ncbi:HNH endonuclease signature motif containing protein [Leeuwenhoekiella sp. ZYFB001]|uniref:HNH endonuclease signature motif containing protein n=1 Tax=Leeuwenhoekiella sp. ZYFB001 TaxID=2719912 RepID=UPI0014310A36|nr:HNH endonuclease signature motif containing protein [Leeuwenhoekiella sp. ZYFB001]
MRKKLTKKDREFIISNRIQLTSVEIAEKIGFHKSTVQRVLREEGLQVSKKLRYQRMAKKMTGRTSFTPEMDAFLIENYLKMPVKPLGEKIGKSFTGVMIRLKQLGLKIPRVIVEKRKRESRIQKGTVPPNRGKPQKEWLSGQSLKNVQKTQFKKGQDPHNTKYNGHERISKDGYIEIRIKKGKYVLKHRHIWEQVNGKIPDKHILSFKDGNPLNCQIENLEIKSMRENMIDNSLMRYPKPIRKSQKLIWEISHKIKQNGKE